MSPFLFSLIVCTRDRARSLEKTLASLRACREPGVPWELLIVDNGSSDDTHAVVKGQETVLPIRYVSAPQAGLSNARNAGLENAKGEFMVWTDDDVLVEVDFLSSYAFAFLEHKEIVLFGGRSIPEFLSPTERWFVDNTAELEALLGLRNDPSRVDITSDFLPFGLNFAIRADVQRRFLFDPNLGVAPGRRRGEEERDVMLKVLSAGMSGRWVWSASVQHQIPTNRQTARYIFSYYRASGFDWPIVEYDETCLSGVRIHGYILREIAKLTLKLALFRDDWVKNLRDAAKAFGTYDRRRAGLPSLTPVL